jgi:hypothetical protein
MISFVIVLFCFLNPQSATRSAPCDSKKLPTFEDYPTSAVYEGKAHSPVLATPLDRKYRTTITEAIAAGANFAGHFAIAAWGCGMGCKEFVVVDVKTGIVHDPRFDEIGYHYPSTPDYDPGWQCYSDLLTYRRDSRLLVVEGCLLRGKQCGRTYLLEDSGKLRQVALDPDLLQNGKIAPY